VAAAAAVKGLWDIYDKTATTFKIRGHAKGYRVAGVFTASIGRAYA
jgi:hypothetical protein